MIGTPIPSPKPIEPHMIDRAALLKRFNRPNPHDAFDSPLEFVAISFADAAAIAGVSTTTITNWLNNATIPHGVWRWNAGRRWLVRDRFLAWLDEAA